MPDLRNADTLFGDFETTSGDKKLKSTNPWKNCFPAGMGVTVDDAQGAWYVPVTGDLSFEVVQRWWHEVVGSCKRWVNHNVKYDAHVSALSLGWLPDCELVDTLTLAKIIDSDRQRKGGYALDALSSAWLHEDISRYWQALQCYLENGKIKDYGVVPHDVMGEYCCQDVISNRRLWKFLQAQCPAECKRVWDTEIELTTVLLDVERVGMRVDPTMLKIKELEVYARLHQLDSELAKLVGRSFAPHTNADCFDVLCNQYGLPVLAWTAEKEDEDDPNEEQPGNPSFDKEALKAYLVHPFAPTEVVKRVLEYRTLNTFCSLFVKKYQEQCTLDPDGCYRMHPTYNQCVRTGRLSCKNPNAQQLSALAKTLVLPSPGCAFLSADYSQIEYRTMMHYVNDRYAVEAYNKNPDVDFHKWVGEMMGMSRRPAKTMNFAMGYGMGKKRTKKNLAANSEITGNLLTQVEHLPELERRAEFEKLAGEKAEKVYNDYHENLPGLKRTARAVEQACRLRGYVFDLRGRRRHLPQDKAHIAFNSINQASAADIMKERTVALWKALRNTHIRMVANVHDESLKEGPIEVIEDPRTQHAVASIMEHPDVELRVPIRVSMGTSQKHWKEACKGPEGGPEPGPVFYAQDCDTSFSWCG